MKVDLTEDEIRLLMEAAEHFDAYLHSQRRESDEVKALLNQENPGDLLLLKLTAELRHEVMGLSQFAAER